MRTISLVPTARALRDTGFWLTAVTVTSAFIYVAAETVRDPGGTEAMVAVGSWVLPLVALLGLVYLWREAATAVVLPALLVPIGLALFEGLDPTGWQEIRADAGPVDALAVMFLGLALACIGLNEEETHLAGLGMVTLTVVPPTLMFLVAGEVLVLSTALVAVPVLVGGVLYVWAAAVRDREDSRAVDEELRDMLPVA